MIADVLNIYATEHGPQIARPETLAYSIKALLPFWGGLTVDKIRGELCRRYLRERDVADGTVRRELGVLVAALNHCKREGYLLEAPAVWMPSPAKPRERWLTRSEAAALLWAARRYPHLARFILIGLYTGSRSEVIRNLQWVPNMVGGHVDLERGLLHRQAAAARATKKRAPTVRIQRRLLAHLRRWRPTTRQWIVEWKGGPIQSLKRSWGIARTNAGLGLDVTPHILRHTAITWAMQGGAQLSDIAGLFGVTVAELERTYAHHHPDHMQSALDALERK